MCHQLNRNSVFVTPYIAESGKPLQMDSQNDLIINRRRAEAAQKIFPYTSVKTNLRTIPHVSIAVYLQNMYWQIANVSVMLWYYICTAKKKRMPKSWLSMGQIARSGSFVTLYYGVTSMNKSIHWQNKNSIHHMERCQVIKCPHGSASMNCLLRH